MALFCAPMLTYSNVCSASVLEDRHFRLVLTNFQTVSQPKTSSATSPTLPTTSRHQPNGA